MNGEIKLWYCDIAQGLIEAVERYELAAETLIDARVRALDPSTCDVEPTETQALEAFDRASLVVAEYFKAELVERTDSFIGWINDSEDLAAARRRKGKELIDLAKTGEERLAWFKQITLRVMAEIGKRKLEGVMGRLRIQGNGGVQPVEVRQPQLLPERYQRFELRITGEDRARLLDCPDEAIHAMLDGAKPIEPDSDMIRRDLLAKVTCPACLANGDVECPTCNGEGSVSGSVPGAVLLDRGEHLRVR